MPAENQLPPGLYEQLLDEELGSLLESRPDLIATIVAIDDESAPHTYSQFLAQLLHQALPISKPDERLAIINRLIDLLSAEDGLDYTRRKKLLCRDSQSPPRDPHHRDRHLIAQTGNLTVCQQPPNRLMRRSSTRTRIAS